MRTGDLAVEQVALLLADFEADWYGEPSGTAPRFLPVAAGLPEVDVVAFFGDRLRAAVAAEGFLLLPPALSDRSG